MSAPYDGKTFRCPWPVEDRGLREIWRWQRTKQPKPWPAQVALQKTTKPETRVDTPRVTLVNHATLLVQMAGMNFLTDPVWSERVSPFTFVGPKRCIGPGVALADLPPIDAVLLSHDHYDHCDVATLKRLEAMHAPLVVTGLKMGRILSDAGMRRVLELDWWQATAVGDVTVTFAPAQHWSSRAPGSRNTRLWGSFILASARHNVYFAADTGFGPHFAMIRERLGPMDLAMIPIGAYEPRWFMRPQHMDPKEALEAHGILGAKQSIGIHWGTFRLTDEGREDPAAALVSLGDPSFVPGENGDVLELASR